MVSRTYRAYNGTQPSAKKMSDLLPDIVSAIGRQGRQEKEVVFAFWCTLLGEKMAPLTEPISLVEGVLTIKIKSATLYSLLSLHERPRLLKQLQEKFPIRKLVFRVG